MENVLYMWGRRSNVFINFMLSVLLSNSYNICFLFILQLSPADRQGCLWHNIYSIGPQSWCGWRYLIFYVLNPIFTVIFSFTRFYQHICWVVYFYWSKHWVNRMHLREWKGEFCSIYLSRPSSGRWWYRALIWYDCRVKWEPLYGCCYASVWLHGYL